MEGVDVVHHPEGRLRLADGDHVLHLERTERARARRRPDRLAGLREHVVREAVAWMVERSVANRVHDLERQAHDADEGGPTFDADDLRRHSHPGHPFPKELHVTLRPVRRGVDPAAHVQPLDDDRAVELLRVRRAVDEEARLVGRRLPRRNGPHPVVAERRRVRESARRAGDEVLGLLVADRCQVERRRGDEGAARARDRTFDGGARDLGARRRRQDENEDGDGRTSEPDGHGTSWGGFDTLETTYRQGSRGLREKAPIR